MYIACFFDDEVDDLHVSSSGYDSGVFKVKIWVNGKLQTARVTFEDGYFLAVQTPKPEKFYQGSDFEFVSVTSGTAKDDMTTAIDRLEHGRPEDV